MPVRLIRLLLLLPALAAGCRPAPGRPVESATRPSVPAAAPFAASPVAGGGVWRSVAAGYLRTCAIRDDRSLWCWGFNSSGQVGDGTRIERPAPVRVGDGNDWLLVAPGDHATCGLRAGGSLWCWGSHDNGAPGMEGRTADLQPRRILGDPAGSGGGLVLADFAFGDGHACGLAGDGSVHCRGHAGRLGDGSRDYPDQTGRVDLAQATGSHPVRLAVGSRHSCLLLGDGRIVCWGADDKGQLGDGGGGREALRPVPLAAVGPVGGRFRLLSAGTYHSCAVAGGREVVCWGGNEGGVLRTGDRSHRYAPVPVEVGFIGPDEELAEIACGFNHTCLLTGSGRVFCWEGDAAPLPVLPPGGGRFVMVSAGCNHSCGIDERGGLSCWGGDDHGQLGLGGGGSG